MVPAGYGHSGVQGETVARVVACVSRVGHRQVAGHTHNNTLVGGAHGAVVTGEADKAVVIAAAESSLARASRCAPKQQAPGPIGQAYRVACNPRSCSVEHVQVRLAAVGQGRARGRGAAVARAEHERAVAA